MAVIRRWCDEGWTKGHVEVADEIIHPNFKVHGAGGQVIEPGIEGLKQLITAWRTGFPDAVQRVDQIMALGDTVIVRLTWEGTHLGDFMGTPATGKKVSVGDDRHRPRRRRQGRRRLGPARHARPADHDRRDGPGDRQRRDGRLGPAPAGPPRVAYGRKDAHGLGDLVAQEEQNKATYRRFVEEVINTGNIDVIPELYQADYIDHSRPPGAPGGLDGVRTVPEMFRGAFPGPAFHDRLDGRRGRPRRHVT